MFSFLRWEFWPVRIFYLPVYLKIFFTGIIKRSFTFFTTVNPDIPYSGLLNYPKWEVIEDIDPRFLPKTKLWETLPAVEGVLSEMKRLEMAFPIVLKPNIGERSSMVEIIESEEGIRDYLANGPAPLLMQECIPGPVEVGVMFVRLPGEERGDVTSVVIKEPLILKGNGKSTFEELVRENPRGSLYLKFFREKFRERWTTVIPENESIELTKVRAHCMGTTFLDGSEYITDDLKDVTNELSRPLKNFCLGRYDLRCESMESLLKGEFKVIELNGVISEPAHIYDPGNTLFRAWRDLLRHWDYIVKISEMQIKRGVKPTPLRELAQAIRSHDAETKKRTTPDRSGRSV